MSQAITGQVSEQSFVPPTFEVPTLLETEQFRLRPLTMADAEKDYAALMESSDLINAMFGRDWPDANYTLEDNLADVADVEREWAEREAFTYTVVSLDEATCLGCVYINPPRGHPADARVYIWVRQSEYDRGLDPILFHTVRAWIADRWPFQNVIYPGRHDDGSWFPLEGRMV